MFDNTNDYELKTVMRDGKTIYIATFENGTGQQVESEISQSVANALFRTFVKKERNFRRSDERNLEHSELTEQTLHHRILNIPKSLEEQVDGNIRYEQLHKAIEKLPKTQRRRMIYYYFEHYTLEQIAGMEGCSVNAIHKSIKDAKENLKKFLN